MLEIAPRNPSRGQAIAELEAQHANLRELMDRCDELAAELLEGRGEATVLTREVMQLRLAFDVHNQYEETVLRPLIASTCPKPGIRIDGLFKHHVGEHHEMRGRLASDETTILRDVLASLRIHLDAEERYLMAVGL